VGIHGVTTSLMWNGIREYSEQNSSLLEEVFKKVSAGWVLTLDWDLGQVRGKHGFQVFENLEHISDQVAQAAAYARSAKSRQSDKEVVFVDVRRWFRSFIEPPLPPEDIRNFSAMAETLFWLGHLRIESPLRKAITGALIDRAVEELPVYLLGEFIRGLRTCDSKAYDMWLEAHRNEFVAQLRREAAIANLIESDEAAIAHYLIDLDRQSTVLRRRGDVSNSAEVTIHDLTIERIELLSNLLPGKQRYGAVGYGHRMSLIPLLWDDAEKPGVLAENLHAAWSPRFNALARGYAERRFRPDTWAEYFHVLHSLRERVLAALDDLRRAIRSLTKLPSTDRTTLLQDPTGWDECRKELNSYPLLPKVAVDEWGFISESSSGESADSRSKRYAGLRRFAPVRKAVSEYTAKVGNFLSQAPGCLVLVSRLRNADTHSAKRKLLSAASNVGVSDQLIRLSVINSVEMCAADDELQRAARAVFGNLELPCADSIFCEHERREFYSTAQAWCTFIEDDTRNEASERARKNSKRRKGLPRKSRGNDDLLAHTKNRLKSFLQALRKEGILARVLSDTVPWKDMPALWISCDTSHPIASLNALQRIWHQLVVVCEPDRDKITRAKAIDLLWSAIIVVPLVCGKSLERQAIPHFKGVTYTEPPDLDQCPWMLLPEPIPNDVWPQLGLEHWEVQSNWAQLDRLTVAFGILFHHVDHMADFNRLDEDLDELGFSLVQSYLYRETARVQPLLQDAIDTYTEVLAKLPDARGGMMENRPNMRVCNQLLVGLWRAIMPTPDFHEQAKLSIREVVDWRDRLGAGMQQLGGARYFWMADSLNLGPCPDVS